MFVITAWKGDGPKGEAALAEMRCAKRIEFALFVARWTNHPDCVLVTKTRSDKQSSRYEDLWIRPGYSSETTPPGSKAQRPRTGRKAADQKGACPCCGQAVTA